MKRDGSKQAGAGGTQGNEELQPARRPAPGKVTLTSKLSPGREHAVQRQAATIGTGAATPARSRWEHTTDSWMDVAHRGVTALAERGPHAVQASPTSSPPATSATTSAALAASAVTLDPPQPGIDRPGFIDSDDGSNIRTGPAELQGVALTAQPLPPATRVFVSGTHPRTSAWWYVTAFLPGSILRGYVQHFRVNTDLPEPTARLYQIRPGDTVERLAVQAFSAAIRPGHDLRYYDARSSGRPCGPDVRSVTPVGFVTGVATFR